MPKGIARTEPIGLWRPGASVAEQIEAARAWVAKLMSAQQPLPPFHAESSRDRVA